MAMKQSEILLKPGETIDGKDYVEYATGMVRGSNDPVWFVQNILGFEQLYPWQEKYLRIFYRHKYDTSAQRIRDLYIAAGQRSGKTMFASIVASYAFFDIARLPDPQRFFRLHSKQKLFLTMMATSERLAQDGIFSNMSATMEDNEWLSQWFDFKFKNGRIDYEAKHIHAQVLGSWINTAVGRTNFFVGLDEIDYFEETGSKRSSWEILSRMNKSRDTLGDYGVMMVISSPKTISGPILTLANQSIKDAEESGIENVKSIGLVAPTWELNPMPEFSWPVLSEQYKHDMITLWRDYGCKPELAGGLQFPEGVFMDPNVENILRSGARPKEHYQHVMAIDPAVKNDKFGIGVGYRRPLGNIVIDGSFYFRKLKGDPYIMPSDVWEFIAEAIPRCNVSAFLFDAWMFPEIIQRVQDDFGISAQMHKVTKEDYDSWRSYQSPLAKQPLQLCWDRELKEEADQLVTKEGRGGTPVVDHLYNKTKDASDCVANIVWYLTHFELTSTMAPITGFTTFRRNVR